MKNIIENNWVSKWTPGKKEEKDVDLKQPETFAEYQKKTMSTERILSSDRVLKKLLLVMNLLIFFGGAYVLHLVWNLPLILLREKPLFSLVYLLPRLVYIPILLIVMLLVDGIFLYKVKVSWSEEHFNLGQKGTARFTTTEEIKEQYKAIEPLETGYPGNPGILIARHGQNFYIDDSVVSNLILGITRSGKGEVFVKTSLEIYSRAEKQPSLIINDPKLELYKVFAKILEQREYEVHLLNASNPKLSMGFNPVSVALKFYKQRDYDTAEQVVNSLAYSYFDVEKAKGDMVYFVSAAAALFAAMILASMEDAILADQIENAERYRKWCNLPQEEQNAHPFRNRDDNEKTINLYSMVINFGQMVTTPVDKNGNRTLLDVYFESRPATDRARLKYLGVQVAPGKTKSGVFSEMLREIDIFTLNNVAKMTAESTLDFTEIGFGEKPIAVFLSTPSYDASLYKLPTIFIRQMYYVLGKRCDDGKGKCDRQVKVILDEAGNMPSIELMKVMTTMGLGQNISFDIYLQNYEQLEEQYGKEIAQTIRGNCANHFYLQTNSQDTAESFSGMLGNRSVVDVQRAGAKLSLQKYYTESIGQEPLLDKNKLMELREGEVVIFRRSKRRDLHGNKVKPRPIFNSIEEGRELWYAYEYMPKEKYPHPNEVDFLTICTESREHIHPEERIWDLQKSWKLFDRKKESWRILGHRAYEELIQILERQLGKNAAQRYHFSESMTVPELVDAINRIEELETVEKEVCIELIQKREGGENDRYTDYRVSAG
ncbi:type IV secretion system protein VirD4 [Faecalimonas umbilicata]|uniref:Type IV secretion system protein VirD4 n=1 Tax=Faecalimonas umbilicata TaxID=1912855 RepID=A0A4V2UNZ2_9FIRM|nr:type IV secretory system conjugative DNA transfer family protein [Faecalimonas umbilicata]TCS63931.1 type IV secretion system protein VirD4 [Faecalimonas umbilicata]GBU06071.1 hypothetical protein FAEUMB_26120 [Faecalimonas umbilicata]